MTYKRCLTVALLMWGVTSTALADTSSKPPALLLVPGLYGLTSASVGADFLRAIGATITVPKLPEADAINGDADSAQATSATNVDIASPKTSVVTKHQLPELVINRLKVKFDEAFAEEKVDRITPANKYRTYAVSLEMLRAEKYEVKRPDGTMDVYLPVSLRLYVTSILSGEVLFSRALTSYRNLRELQADMNNGVADAHIDAAYRENVLSLVDRVIAETREQFRPFQVSAKVVAHPLGLYVVDRGMDAGIAKGAELVNANGAGIRILQTGKGYAVGEATLGDIRDGEELAMYATTAAGDIVKPRALVIKADGPNDLSGDYAAVQFAENLGNRAAFTIVPVNPDFQSVLQTVSTTEGIQQTEVTQKRVLPDYFIRLKLPEPVIYEMPTSKGFSKVRVMIGTAWAELLDQQGRVVYVTQAKEQIEDQIVEGGIAFVETDRRKVLYGNLLKSLSEQFIRDVKFRQDLLTVTAIENQKTLLNDPQQRLSVGQNLRLYRAMPIAAIGADSVLIPIWDMTAGERDGAVVALDRQLPMSGQEEKIRKGDVALLQGGSDGNPQAQTATFCPTLQNKSSIDLGDVRSLAYFAVATGSPLPYFGGDISLSDSFFTLEKERKELSNAGFAKSFKATVLTPTFCYQPLIKVDEISRNCDADSGLCDVEIQIVAGVNLLRNNETSAKKVLVTKSQLKNVPQNDSDTFIRTQAVQKLFPLLADSVRQLVIPAADNLSQNQEQGK